MFKILWVLRDFNDPFLPAIALVVNINDFF